MEIRNLMEQFCFGNTMNVSNFFFNFLNVSKEVSIQKFEDQKKLMVNIFCWLNVIIFLTKVWKSSLFIFIECFSTESINIKL